MLSSEHHIYKFHTMLHSGCWIGEFTHLNSPHFIFFFLKSVLAMIILEIELNSLKTEGGEKKVPSATNVVCHSLEQKQEHLLKMKMCSEQKGAPGFYCSNKMPSSNHFWDIVSALELGAFSAGQLQSKKCHRENSQLLLTLSGAFI